MNKLKHKYILLSVLCVATYKTSLYSMAYFNTDSTIEKHKINLKTNSIYGEIGGNGIAYSFNYDRLFIVKHDPDVKLSVSAGVTAYKKNYFRNYNNERIYFIPFQFNILIGQNENFLEIGAGLTFSYGERYYLLDYGTRYAQPIDYLYDLIFIPRIGYRRQSEYDLLFFKVGITPLFFSSKEENSYESNPVLWGGISLGISF